MAICCFFSLFMCVLQHPDAKMMQINLTGFLNGKNAREFMKDLWPLLLSAQENIAGIPSAFLEQKKEEIRQRQVGKMLISQKTLWCYTWLWRNNVPFVEMCAELINIFAYPVRLNRRSSLHWKRLMKTRRKKTRERGPSPEAPEGQKKTLKYGTFLKLFSKSTIDPLFLLCPGERQDHHPHGEGRQRSGKENAACHTLPGVNSVQLQLVHHHHWCSCPPNHWSS